MQKKFAALPALLAAFAALGPFSIDTYLPAFQDIQTSLQATPAQVQLSLTAYMGTFALMTLWHGALSDSYGRRRIILLFTALYSLASLLCACANSIEMLWLGRALQGLCGGAGGVVGRAIVRDVFDGPQAQRVMSRVMVMFVIAPAVAPILGGGLLIFFGWRSTFIFLTVLGAALTLAGWRALPETLPVHARPPFNAQGLLNNYWRIFTSPVFILLSMTLAFNFNGFFIYVLSSPVFLVQLLGLSEQSFAWLFVPAVIGMMGGATLSGKVAGKWSSSKTISVAFAIMAISVVWNLALNWKTAPTVPWAVAPVMSFNLGMSLAMPSLTLLTLDLFPTRRGMASSCQTFLQIALNTFNSGLIAPFLNDSTMHISLGMAGFFALGLTCFLLYLRVKGQQTSPA